jgi:hypothetical protein
MPNEIEESDECPTTGEEDCGRCSGAYCGIHITDPCDCDVLDRHRNYYDEDFDYDDTRKE